MPPRCRVLPVPYEATVSYESGTAQGPSAILTASAQVELYDREFGTDPYAAYGVQTLDPFSGHSARAGTFIEALTLHTESIFDAERLIVGLGGEHTVTVGLVRGTSSACERPLTLVQIDAHADLRNEYESNPFSHACIARRLLEDGVERIIQIGIRSVCAEEADVIDRDPRVMVFWAEDMHADPDRQYLDHLALELADSDVYLSIDVDGLDPGVIAATGTPEPGGLAWGQTLEIIGTVARASSVLGLDVVELAPRPGLHASDFAAAKLTYLAVNRVVAGRGWL